MWAQVMSAASDSAGFDPFNYLTGLGFPGIIIALLLTGQLRTKNEVEHLMGELSSKDDIIKAKDLQIESLQKSIVDKAIPALTRSTQILETLPNDERSLFNKLVEAQREISALSDRLSGERRQRGGNGAP